MPRPAQPDPKVVPIPGRAATGRRPRDPRIDLFRGIALVMILVNHMPGNPWEVVTVRNLGFSDAAEAFFVMSGMAAGIAYSPAVGRWLDGTGSLRDAVAPMWTRAWMLYLVQIVLTVIALGLFAWAADVFWTPELREMHNLALVFTDPAQALAGIPTLAYQIGYVNILPTYIVLMLAAPAVMAAGLRWPWPALAASVALWWISGVLRLNLTGIPDGAPWFLAPTSWQLIFVIGVLTGIRHRTGARLVPVSPVLFPLALGALVFSFAWMHLPDLADVMNRGMARLGALGVPYHIVSHDKTILALPRLLHILALVYVLSCLPAVRTLAGHRAAAPLRLLGQHGLLVFSLGTVLALTGQILMVVEPQSLWLPWILPPVAAAICYAAARVRTMGTRTRSPVAEADPRPALATARIRAGS